MKNRIAALLMVCLMLIPLTASVEANYGRLSRAGDKALGALEAALGEQCSRIYVYRDFGDTENHFTQKAKMFGVDERLVMDMDENWHMEHWKRPGSNSETLD